MNPTVTGVSRGANLVLAHVDLRKAAFAYLRADEELSNQIVARLHPARRSSWFGHDFSWMLAMTRSSLWAEGL